MWAALFCIFLSTDVYSSVILSTGEDTKQKDLRMSVTAVKK